MQGTVLRGACILVVDDNESVREMIALILDNEGCEVLTAEDGVAAVAFYRENWREIDVVILDLMMPQMSGLDAYRSMKIINPDVRAIISSGCGADEYAQEASLEGIHVFLPKPFTRERLLEAIARGREA